MSPRKSTFCGGKQIWDHNAIKQRYHHHRIIFPGLVPGEKTAVILDVNNLFKRAQAHGLRLDYRVIIDLTQERM